MKEILAVLFFVSISFIFGGIAILAAKEFLRYDASVEEAKGLAVVIFTTALLFLVRELSLSMQGGTVVILCFFPGLQVALSRIDKLTKTKKP